MRRRKVRVRWICATGAPWALAVGLLVSFTARAGHDPGLGLSFTPALTVAGPLAPPDLVPASDARGREPIRLAALRFELPEEPLPILAPPRDELKPHAAAFPAVERGRKGDPLISLRPSLSRQGRDVMAARAPLSTRLMFTRSERALPPTVLLPGPVQPPDLEEEPGFLPWGADETATTRHTTAARSPEAAASGSTGPGGRPVKGYDGATPSVARAVAIASVTPAPADATPIEVAAAPVSFGHLRLTPRPQAPVVATPRDGGARPNYAELVTPETLDKESRCLAEAVYFEARSEPETGQAAVAQVVLNRARSGLYPKSICGVVYQNRHRHLACQFTFACEGKSLRITDQGSWSTATRIAKAVLEGKTYLVEVGGSTHYHADYVRPRWARRLTKMDVIGRHIFYKLKPGQT
jgi:spore germination cell wall hydrolase CwlJ-like protein